MIRWIVRGVALCVLGPWCAKIAQGVRANDGSEHASFLVSEGLGKGAGALAMILGGVVVAGVVIAKLLGRREAMFNMAMIFGWVAWTGGRMGEMFRVTQGGFVQLAIEAGLIGAAVVAVLVVASKNEADEDLTTLVDFQAIFRGTGLMALGAAMVAAIAGAWAFGQTDLPGQSLWASFLGGIVGGLIGAMVQQSGDKGSRQARAVTMVPMIFGVLAAGVIAPLIGMVVPGSGKLLESIASGSLPGWLAVSPVAWSVGALLGVPIGMGWVESTAAMHEPAGQTA